MLNGIMTAGVNEEKLTSAIKRSEFSKVMFCKVRFFVYPGIYPGIVSSVQHYALPDRFCEFCKTFIPLLDSPVTSVRLSYPYPTVL